MDRELVKKALTSLLTDVAAKAREDALANKSDIGSVFRQKGENLGSLDGDVVEQAIIDINKATATKEGTRRLINGIMIVARTAARIVYPNPI